MSMIKEDSFPSVVRDTGQLAVYNPSDPVEGWIESDVWYELETQR